MFLSSIREVGSCLESCASMPEKSDPMKCASLIGILILSSAVLILCAHRAVVQNSLNSYTVTWVTHISRSLFLVSILRIFLYLFFQKKELPLKAPSLVANRGGTVASVNGFSSLSQKSLSAQDSPVKETPLVNEFSLLSPMPGKCTRLFVNVGQRVEKGNVLCVVEAMKMENWLYADKSGKISSICVQEGDRLEMEGRILTIEI